jgi:hypothetical protein
MIIVQGHLIQQLHGLVTRNFEPENIRAIAREREEKGFPCEFCFSLYR